MTKRHGKGPGRRLETGATILANAQVVDSALVKTRLAAFITAHRSYTGAQNKVDAAEADLRRVAAKATRRERDVDEAVEALAVALVNEGHRRTKPFAHFGGVGPSMLKHLAVSEKAKAVRQLAATVQQSRTATQKSRDVAGAAEQAARSMLAALVPLDPIEHNLERLRGQRDTLGQPWDRALAALRRGARSAADEGAPHLYTALFGQNGSLTRKNGKPTPAPAPAPAPASAGAPGAA